MQSIKQGGIKYHSLSLWYDSTWDWTQISRAIGEHSNHHANVRFQIYIYILREIDWEREGEGEGERERDEQK